MVTLGELLTVQSSTKDKPPGPTAEKTKLVKEAVSAQCHLSSQQQTQLWEELIRHHEAVSLCKSNMGRSDAVPHFLRLK